MRVRGIKASGKKKLSEGGGGKEKNVRVRMEIGRIEKERMERERTNRGRMDTGEGKNE